MNLINKLKNICIEEDEVAEENDATDFKIGLGARVRDKITGFKGIVTSRTQWLHNCNVYGVQPEGLDKDSKVPDRGHFDEPALELLEDEVVEPKRDTGGPTDPPSRTSRL